MCHLPPQRAEIYVDKFFLVFFLHSDLIFTGTKGSNTVSQSKHSTQKKKWNSFPYHSLCSLFHHSCCKYPLTKGQYTHVMHLNAVLRSQLFWKEPNLFHFQWVVDGPACSWSFWPHKWNRPVLLSLPLPLNESV